VQIIAKRIVASKPPARVTVATSVVGSSPISGASSVASAQCWSDVLAQIEAARRMAL
jgi:hypothetical protein